MKSSMEPVNAGYGCAASCSLVWVGLPDRVAATVASCDEMGQAGCHLTGEQDTTDCRAGRV